MNRKTYTIIGIAILLIAIGSLVITRQEKPDAIKAVAACTMKDNSLNLKVSTSDENNLASAASDEITNVPAGTHTDINIKTYNGSTATGSTLYAGSYGSYNFTAKKNKSIPEPSNQINWVITSFIPCKR